MWTPEQEGDFTVQDGFLLSVIRNISSHVIACYGVIIYNFRLIERWYKIKRPNKYEQGMGDFFPDSGLGRILYIERKNGLWMYTP